MNYPDYPFAHHYHSINGLRLHYLDEGDQQADNIVMLHGNPSWSFYYRRLVSALCSDYRCLVPDHIGMGLSDKPTQADYRHTLDQRVDDLEALLEHLNITDNITLVLHDWGGMIGMAYAMRHPQSLKRLVVLNSAAFHLPAGKTIPWQLRLSRVPLLGAMLNQGCNIFARAAIRLCVTRAPLSSQIAAAYLAPYDSWANRCAMQKFITDIPLQQGEPAYQTVDQVDRTLKQFSDIPILICWGMRDFVFDKDFLAQWQIRFPHAEVHSFADAGHYVLEDAADEIIPIVQRFLQRHKVLK